MSGQHVTGYSGLRPQLEQGARVAERLITALIDAESINYLSVTARAKEVESFAKKAAKCDFNGRPKYADPLQIQANQSQQITDLVAVRVITYIPDSVDRVCEIVRNQFEVAEEIDKGAQVRERGTFGYASKHFVVRLDTDRRRLPENQCLGTRLFEIQVRTIGQHAWAEFEHDIRYKGDVPEDLTARLNRSFLLSAALLEMADKEFAVIDDLVRQVSEAAPSPTQVADSAPGPQASSETRLDASDLPNLLSKRYPDAPRSKKDHYEWIVSALNSCGISTVEQLERALASVESEQVSRVMKHTLPAGQVRRLDDDLLVALDNRYREVSLKGTLDSSRRDILKRRLEKLTKAGIIHSQSQ